MNDTRDFPPITISKLESVVNKNKNYSNTVDISPVYGTHIDVDESNILRNSKNRFSILSNVNV